MKIEKTLDYFGYGLYYVRIQPYNYINKRKNMTNLNEIQSFYTEKIIGNLMNLFSENKGRIVALDAEIDQCESTKNYNVLLNDDGTSTVSYYVGNDFLEKTLVDMDALNSFLDEIEGESKKKITKIENKKNSIETENSLIQRISSQKNFSFSISYAHKDLSLDFESSDPAIKKFLNSKSKFLTANFDESKPMDNVDAFLAVETIDTVELDTPGIEQVEEVNELGPNDTEPSLDNLFENALDSENTDIDNELKDADVLGAGFDILPEIDSQDSIVEPVLYNNEDVSDDMFNTAGVEQSVDENVDTAPDNISQDGDNSGMDDFFDIEPSTDEKVYDETELNEDSTPFDDGFLSVGDNTDIVDSDTVVSNDIEVTDDEDFLGLGSTQSYDSAADETPHNTISDDVINDNDLEITAPAEDDFLGLGTGVDDISNNIETNDSTPSKSLDEDFLGLGNDPEVTNDNEIVEDIPAIEMEDDFLGLGNTQDIVDDNINDENEDSPTIEMEDDFLGLGNSVEQSEEVELNDPLSALGSETNEQTMPEIDFLGLGNDIDETNTTDTTTDETPEPEIDFLGLGEPSLDDVAIPTPTPTPIPVPVVEIPPVIQQTPQIQPIIIQLQQPVTTQFVATPIPTTITEDKDVVKSSETNNELVEDPLASIGYINDNTDSIDEFVPEITKEVAPEIVMPKRTTIDEESEKKSLDFLSKIKTVKTKIFPSTSFIVKKEGLLDKFSGREKILTLVTAVTFIFLVIGGIFGSNTVSSIKSEYSGKEDSFNQEITTLKTQVKGLEAEKEELIGKKKDAEEKSQPILGSAKNLSLANIDKIKVDEESDPKMSTSVIKNKYLVVKLPSLQPAAGKKLTIVLNDGQSIDYIIKKSISGTSDGIPQIIENIEKELSTKPEDQRFFVLVGTDSKQYYIAQP